MAFEGNIKDFGVADVLQLINSQGKTGVLTFHEKKEIISIGFENGMISSASHNRKGVLKPIGDYLVLTGKITNEELKRYDAISKKKGIPVVDTLVENNVLTREVLEKIIEFKIQEIVDELFTWKKGEYKFQLGERLYSRSKYSVLVNPQFLILEGMRRIDEWPKIKKAIPDYNIVFRKKKRPSLSVEMGEQEKIVIDLIDGKMCVDDIAQSSGLGKFRTYHSLYNLLESGVIERTTVIAEPKLRKKKPFAVRTKETINLILWIVAVLFLLANITFRLVINPFHKMNQKVFTRESQHIENYRKQEINELMLIYRIIKGKEPESIDELKREGWLKE
ncbi:DUF4388 domain-containing protein [candidate division WOR-3 bacterium]|nr:DUF4388 domain-containing protein [candidate division WOR-3 bacterium]MCK4576478.1 DUF4388 domain-containing protein [candidate division WOR-3 bacterium]